ncbi:MULTISPECIES: HNH endonuclease [unclassified Ruegeria]|uniref:HNH endonuclease n=1 Tax=unclassified Ruegeria TaxID=2625375 RepID=UPI001492701B|nr:MULTISPECIES: HNH endonuclease [unclassified Ruegeria]NOD87414.1 hypothetical protein [Ruegeria sp. HKCCD4318]NOE12969.1 hypothetical protein [Ruegeria sp. HKCCD4318-2]NOG08864.1 hypothetical protein [Ruegeria sp. HKCCD4315]
MKTVDIDLLRILLLYCPVTGLFWWKEREDKPDYWNARWANKQTFTTVDRKGYMRGAVERFPLYAHRAAWAIMYETWPDYIDHINGDRSDNRILNLRNVTPSDNQKNQKRRLDNSSGVIGVSFHKHMRKWQAQICSHGKQHHLGVFNDKTAAIAARKAAEIEFGFHPNHGRVV